MSAELVDGRYTRAQLNGVTDTSDRPVSSSRTVVDEPGGRNADLGVWSPGYEPYGIEEWVLPGQGAASPRCGEYYPGEFCSECGEIHYGTHQCGRRTCPDCWNSWSREAAMSTTVRLAAARHQEADGFDRRTVHVVVSPPEGSIKSVVQFKRAWKRAYRLAGEKGVRGGLTIPHGYRILDGVKEEIEAARDRGEHEGGDWRWVREQGEDWREYVKWSPHFHVIGLARDVGEGDPDGDDGWVFKNIRSLKPYSLRDRDGYDDMYGAVRYLLSHATFRDGSKSHAIRWFGTLANTNFGEEEMPSEEVMSVIEHITEEVAESSLDGDDGEGSPDDEPDRCTVDGCEGILVDLFDFRMWERSQDEIPADFPLRRVETALRWRGGELEPPPGMKSPRTEEEAREVLDVLCEKAVF